MQLSLAVVDPVGLILLRRLMSIESSPVASVVFSSPLLSICKDGEVELWRRFARRFGEVNVVYVFDDCCWMSITEVEFSRRLVFDDVDPLIVASAFRFLFIDIDALFFNLLVTLLEFIFFYFSEFLKNIYFEIYNVW